MVASIQPVGVDAAPRTEVRRVERVRAPDTKTASMENSHRQEAPSFTETEHATKRLNEAIQTLSSNLEFVVDNDTGRTVVKVVDQMTKEVIRQIPAEEILEISKALERFQGLIVQRDA